jgi:Ca-activated chloride channel family protein
MEDIHGLRTAEGPVPLEGVHVSTHITGLTAEVRVAQRYRNRERRDIEAVYTFPLDAAAAVCGFEARVGERRIAARIEERDRAFEVYDDALSEGHGAFLLDQERPDVFTASVGNLRPGQAAEVVLRYAAPLSFEGDAIRFVLPTTVSPRYVPGAPPEVGEADGDRLNPERRDAVPYGLTLDVTVDQARDLAAVDSPSHPVRTAWDEDVARVSLSAERVALDRDFVLLLTRREADRPTALVAREQDGTRVVLVQLRPRLDESERTPAEVVFVLDCSGSMGGDSIGQARRALLLCVRALSEGDTFNVVRFGSRHVSLWPTPRAFGDATLGEASRWIEQAQADLGGTEILSALRSVLEGRETSRPLQVLVLTDGEVSNEQDVIALCRRHADHARVFAFGIGAGASQHLVRGMARAGRGASEFIFPGERIEPKVLRMFARVTAPALSDVRVDWGGLDVEAAPARVPPVFSGDPLTVYGRVRSGHATEIRLLAGDRVFTAAVDLERVAAGGAVPLLWARETIRDLEDGQESRPGSRQSRPEKDGRRRERVIELSRRYGILSSETSFVGVEERDEADRTKDPAELRKVPIALTAGWGGRGSVMPQFVSAALPRTLTRAGLTRTGMVLAPPASALAAAPLAKQSGAPGTAGVMGSLVNAGARLFRRSAQPAMVPDAGAPPPASAPAVYPGMDDADLDRSLGAFVAEAEAPYGAADDRADRVFAVLMTQAADGHFDWSEPLAAWLGTRAPAAREAVRQYGESLVATTLVLALLRRDAAGRSDEWSPAARKAERWLARQTGTFDAEMVIAG